MIDEIKERLSKATEGDWHVPGEAPNMVWEPNITMTHENRFNDAEFIAHSKKDIEYLLAKLEKQQRVIDAARELDVLIDTEGDSKIYGWQKVKEALSELDADKGC